MGKSQKNEEYPTFNAVKKRQKKWWALGSFDRTVAHPIVFASTCQLAGF
jgi:hypothetical protein